MRSSASTVRLVSTQFQSAFIFLTCLCIAATYASAEETERQYPFPQTPRTILERLDEMQLGTSPRIGDEEWRILDAAWELRDATVAERDKPEYQRLVVDALLTSSGVTTDSDRAMYRDKLAKLVARARTAIKQAAPADHPGEVLMKFLHEGVMKGGYVEDQTSFANIFESNTHNCVSSTAMYYVVGHELGLNMRIIAIDGDRWLPGHACLDLLDGDNVYEVEPTNPNGFDWAKKLNQPGVFTIGPQPNRKQGHVLDGLGLAASIYSNRAVAVTNVKELAQPDRLAAASLGLRALMCSPYERSAANNVIAVFANWGPEQAKAGRYDEGVSALAFAVTATADDGVKHNFLVTASEQIDALLKSNSDREAQAAIKRATAVLPHAADFQKSAPWIRYSNRCYESDGGKAALAALERAQKAAPAADHAVLSAHCIQVLRRWSNQLLQEDDFDGALMLLVRAYKLDPQNAELHGSIAYHVQQSLHALAKDGTDPAKAVTHYQTILTKFPSAKVVGEMGIAHAVRTLSSMCAEQKFEEALAAAAVYAPIAESCNQPARLLSLVYGEWGNRLKEQMKWAAAVEKYLEGLKMVPNNDRLLTGALSTLDDWADQSMSANDWDGAIRIYDHGLKYFPENGHLMNNRTFCIAKKAEMVRK